MPVADAAYVATCGVGWLTAQPAQALALLRAHGLQQLIGELVLDAVGVCRIAVYRRDAEQQPVGNAPGQAVTQVHQPLLSGALHRLITDGEPVRNRLFACAQVAEQAAHGNVAMGGGELTGVVFSAA